MRKFKLMLVGLALVAGTGCDSLLGTEPRQSVSPEVALDNIIGIEGMVTSMYSRLQAIGHYGQSFVIAPEILADNAIINENPSGRYRNHETNNQGSHIGGWGAYTLINEANYVIASVDEVEAPVAQRARLRGEALTLRALSYHNLVKTYAYDPGHIVAGRNLGVIIRTTPTRVLTDSDFRPRSTVEEVYQLIEQDLLEAIPLLETHGNNNRRRITHGGAQALLARVYLHAGRWNDAVTAATAAMGNSAGARLAEAEEYASIFGAALNPEALFELAYNHLTESAGVNEAVSAIVTPAQWFDVIPSAELLALYDEDDARLGTYRTTAAGVTWNAKFNQHVGAWTDNMPVIRYSEVLLTRAEAYAESGDVANAMTDLNLLRANRGVEALTAASAQEAVDLILRERRMELAFEGHRWYDLKRKGMDIPKAAAAGGATVPYTDFRILAPIPQAQVDLNPNLVQNEGY